MEIQDETPNYDEYNQNNRLVNDVNYSYYFNKNQNLQKNENNNENNTNNISNENNIVNNNNLNENDKNIENNNDIKNNKISTPYNSYNYNTSRISSTIDIKADERRRKKILLNNIQAQINLRKKTKLEELEKEKEEDKKYLKEMFEQYPFGRGGGGAPVRNKKGEVVAFRRNLISDYKYNQSGINIDDDFDEVWGKRKSNNNNADISNNNLNNRYNPNNRPFSTINLNSNNNNNFVNSNNNYNMSSSYDFNNNNNNYNYNNDLDNKIYERRMKLLQLQKEKEEIKNEELKQENIKLENEIYTQSQLPKKNIPNQINLNTNEEYITETETETETTNNNNTITTLKNISNNLPQILNPKDYYDNINFVPKGKINPRLDNNFLFTEEISKLRKDIEMQQTSLLKQISQLKDASLIAKNERNKVYKDLELIKYQINELKEAKNIPEEKEEEDFEINNNNNIGKDHEKIINKNYNYNDYDYIDNKFFSKFENELPYDSDITKEKKIFHLEKNYEDKNLIELDKLIKKSEDIMQNLKENELLEEKFKKKPEDYFNTSDYFFDTYMLTHKNDYLEYANEYKNKYGYYNANNKFMEYNINKNNNINNDYEINIEPI